MAKGVIIIACGNPIYGNMAYNLALSLKYTCPAHVSVVWSEQSLSELTPKQLQFFDNQIECPEHYYKKGEKKAYQRIKCFVNELSPYEETIMIDADTVWNPGKDLSLLFATLKDTDFQVGCLGKWEDGEETYKKYTYWADPKSISEYWKTNLIYKTYSGIVYWKKETQNIWKEIQRVYDDPDAECMSWAGDKPDEYAFNIGIALSGHRLPKIEWMPAFFGYTGYKYTEHLIKQNYFCMSVSGNFPDPYLITIYHHILREVANRTGHEYKEYIKKGSVLTERAKL
jgi:hypothetical protein